MNQDYNLILVRELDINIWRINHHIFIEVNQIDFVKN